MRPSIPTGQTRSAASTQLSRLHLKMSDSHRGRDLFKIDNRPRESIYTMRFPEIEAQRRAEQEQAKAAERQLIQDRVDAENAKSAAEKEEVSSSMVLTHLACPSYLRSTTIAKMGS